MVIIILLIIIFIIYNFRNIEKFTNPIMSPNIIDIKREKDYIDITFQKNSNDNIEPGDNFFYEIYYKKDNEIFEEEKENGELKNELIDITNWNSKTVTCNDIICNSILEIDENDTYYIFILVNLEGRRSNVTNVVKTEEESKKPVYPPDILKIVKKNGNSNIYFRRSGRDTSIPEDKMKYEIYYTQESKYYPTPSPSPSPSPSVSYDFDKWDKKVVICDKLKCTTNVGNLEDVPYLFAIRQIRNENKSMINKIVRVSDTEPYEPLIYESEDYQSGFSFDEDTPCTEYSYNNCPDNLTGTILSRCYKDKEFKRCLPSVEEEYLQ